MSGHSESTQLRAVGFHHIAPGGIDNQIAKPYMRFTNISGTENSVSGHSLRDYVTFRDIECVGTCVKWNCNACNGSELPYVIPRGCGRFHGCTYCLDPHPVSRCLRAQEDSESLWEKCAELMANKADRRDTTRAKRDNPDEW
jgi:hypothetical protein